MEGFLGGWMEMEKHQQDVRQSDLNIQKLALEVDSAKDALAAHDQQMQLFGDRVRAAEQQYGGTPLGEADKLMTWAGVLTDTGQPVAAAALLNGISEIQKRSSEVQIAAATQAEKSLSQAVNGLQGVNDQAGWDQYWNDYFTAHPKIYENPDMAMQMHSIANLPFTPERKKTFLNQYVTQLQTAQIRKAQAETDLARSRAQTEEFRQTQVLPSVVEANKARARSLGKVGGAEAPLKTEDVKAAEDLIGSQYNTAGSEAKARTAAREIALRARQLSVDEGLSMPQARRRALEEARSSGRLAGLRPGRVGLGSFDKPAPVPENKEFSSGMWYTGQPGSRLEGQRVFYDGSQFLTEDEMSSKMSMDLGSGEEIDEPDTGYEEEE